MRDEISEIKGLSDVFGVANRKRVHFIGRERWSMLASFGAFFSGKVLNLSRTQNLRVLRENLPIGGFHLGRGLVLVFIPKTNHEEIE